MATDAELLAAIDNALYSIATKGAASYSIGARSFTALDLGELRAWRNEVAQRINRTAGTLRPSVVRFQEPR